MKSTEKLKNYLKTCDGKVIDVMYEIYSIIEELNFNDQLDAFEFFCENYNEIDSDGSRLTQKNYFTDKQIEVSSNRVIANHINEKIKTIINNALINNLNRKECYKSVWEYIVHNKAFKTKNDKVMALFFVVENDLIPYKNIGYGKEMDNKTFRKIIDDFPEEIFKKIDYIFHIDFPQKTQTSSLLLETLLSLDKKDEQIVLLSILLDKAEERTKENIKSFIDKK